MKTIFEKAEELDSDYNWYYDIRGDIIGVKKNEHR